MTLLASSVGLNNLLIDILNPVPAIVPCKPASPNAPTAAAISSIESPAACAVGARNFIDIPRDCKSVNDDVIVATKTSITLSISAISRPIPLTAEITIPAAVSTSVPATTEN